MFKTSSVILALFMLFSSVGDGIFIFCLGTDGHLALEILGLACSVEEQDHRQCLDNDIHFDDPASATSSHNDCHDILLELSDYYHAGNHCGSRLNLLVHTHAGLPRSFSSTFDGDQVLNLISPVLSFSPNFNSAIPEIILQI